jgi:hypothetical protein
MFLLFSNVKVPRIVLFHHSFGFHVITTLPMADVCPLL